MSKIFLNTTLLGLLGVGLLTSACSSWRELPAEDRAILLTAGIDAVTRALATMESIGAKPGVSPEEVHPTATIPPGLLWPRSNHRDVAPGAAGAPTDFCKLSDGSWEDIGFLRKVRADGYYEICWPRTPTESDQANGEWVLFDTGRSDHVLVASARNRYVKGFSYGPFHNMHDESRMYFSRVYGRQPTGMEKMDLDHDKLMFDALVKEFNRKFPPSLPPTVPAPPTPPVTVSPPPPPACPCPAEKICPSLPVLALIPPDILATALHAPEWIPVRQGKNAKADQAKIIALNQLRDWLQARRACQSAGENK